MATIDLTNIVTNGSFETNVNGWSGFMTNGQGTQSTLAPLRVANNTPAPVHGETGLWCAEMGTKTQGLVYINPTTPIPTIAGHKYYVRARVSLRGSTVPGVTTGCTVVHGTGVPIRGVALPPPLFDGLQTPNIVDWNLIDTIWTADIFGLNMRFIWQQTGNMGNNETYGRVDNIVMVDLTEHFGAGSEPPLFAIRQGVRNVPPNGWWDGTTTITMPIPPVIITDTLPLAVKGGTYSAAIALEENTGTAPFVFSLSGLPLSSGLFIDNNGTISGISNLDEGQYAVEVTVTDSIGYRISKAYILNAGEPPLILDDYIPGATLNQPYFWAPTVTGSDGNLVVSVAVTGGTLPTGLSMSGTTISGTPTVDNQSCQITVTAFNDYEPGGVSRTYTLRVSLAARINTLSPLPNGIVGVPYDFILSAYGDEPVWWHLGGDLPPGLSLDANGVLSGIPTAPGTYSFSIQAANDYGFENRLYSLTVYQFPVITTTTLGYARLGRAYSSQLTATGSMPITWFITGGSLPTGLSLDPSTGIISGEPVEGGSFTFTVVATNIAGNSAPATFTIEAGSALAIVTTSPLPSGIRNVVYTPLTFQAEGLDDSFAHTWSWVAQAGSSFPPGLTLNATSGVLTGTPTAIGVYNVNVTITNGANGTVTAPFTITVGAPPVITSAPNLGGGVSRPFSTVLQASGTLPITWTMTAGPTPSADIQLGYGGALSWLNPVIGIYTFTVVASNVFGDSAPVQFTLTITTPSIIDIDLDDGIVGIPYSHTFTAIGAEPLAWSHTFGSLPPGLAFDPVTGTLSGNPTVSGTYDFTIRVDNIGGYAEEAFTLTILARPIITTLVLNSGNVSSYYSQTLLATGTTPISWSILDPIGDETGLPPGTSLTGATISGMLTTQGVYKFTVRAENITGSDYADTRQLTISIGPEGAPVITTGSPLYATRGIPYTLSLEALSDYPVTWTLDNGASLPNGLSLNDNVISGTPTVAGIFNFTMIADNLDGSDARIFTMIIADPPVITTTVLPDGTTRTAYSTTLSVTGDTPIAWQVMSITGSETGLPPGLSLNTSTGEISGIPATDGIYTFSISATNGAGYDTAALSITIISVGGTFINGKEIGNLFITGKEVSQAFVGGVRIYKCTANFLGKFHRKIS